MTAQILLRFTPDRVDHAELADGAVQVKDGKILYEVDGEPVTAIDPGDTLELADGLVRVDDREIIYEVDGATVRRDVRRFRGWHWLREDGTRSARQHALHPLRDGKLLYVDDEGRHSPPGKPDTSLRADAIDRSRR